MSVMAAVASGSHKVVDDGAHQHDSFVLGLLELGLQLIAEGQELVHFGNDSGVAPQAAVQPPASKGSAGGRRSSLSWLVPVAADS